MKCNDVCKKPISYSNQKSCEHECRQPCGHSGDCSICLEIADKQINGDCGHVIPFRCDKIAYQKDCTAICGVVNPNNGCTRNHACGAKCGACFTATKHAICQTLVEVESTCSHKTQVLMPCSEVEYTYKSFSYCNAPCSKVLSCKHLCKGTCSTCYGDKLHEGYISNCCLNGETYTTYRYRISHNLDNRLKFLIKKKNYL